MLHDELLFDTAQCGFSAPQPLDYALIVGCTRKFITFRNIYGAWQARGSGWERAARVQCVLNELFSHVQLEVFGMAAQKQSPVKPSDLKWVNISLTEGDKREIGALKVTPEQLLAWIGSMVYQGYKFSASWDDRSQACQVAVIGASKDIPDYGFALSSRHPDADGALLSLWFKFTMLCQGGLAAQYSPAPSFDSWS